TYKNGALLKDLQGMEKSQQQHDPKWDLPFDRLRYKMAYDAMLEGGPERAFMMQQAADGKGGNWLKDLNAAESKFYKSLPKNAYTQAVEDNPDGPKYPLSDEQQALMDKYDNASVDDRTNMIQDPNVGPELTSSWNSLAQWENKMRLAQTGPNP